MPLPISLAHKLAQRLADVRKAGDARLPAPGRQDPGHRPLPRRQPVAIEKLLISTQHREGAESLIPDDLWEHVVEPVLPGRPVRRRASCARTSCVNPTGRFVIGGPVGDAGLTGRKIIVDTYGGMARHGGGAFSGKDPIEGRPLGGLRGALRGQERRGRRPGRPLRGAGRLRDRRRAPGLGHGRDVRHREDRPLADRSSSSASTSTCAPARSASTSSCTGRSTRRPPPTATSVARTTTSRGRSTDKADTLRAAAGLGEVAGVA